MYRLRRGLGDASQGVLLGNDVATCNSGWYWLLPFCWELSPAAWSQAAQFSPTALTTAPVAPAAIPAAYSSTAPTVADVEQQTTDSINAAAAATQAANLASSQSQPEVDDTASTNWALWGAVALVGVFGFVALAGGSPRRYGR